MLIIKLVLRLYSDRKFVTLQGGSDLKLLVNKKSMVATGVLQDGYYQRKLQSQSERQGKPTICDILHVSNIFFII